MNSNWPRLVLVSLLTLLDFASTALAQQRGAEGTHADVRQVGPEDLKRLDAADRLLREAEAERDAIVRELARLLIEEPAKPAPRTPIILGDTIDVRSVAEALRIAQGEAALRVEVIYAQAPVIPMVDQTAIDAVLAEVTRINRIGMYRKLLIKENEQLERLIKRGASEAALEQQNAKIIRIVEALKDLGAAVQFEIVPVER
jgi:hypothetical protein